jgi:hypothetical protein
MLATLRPTAPSAAPRLPPPKSDYAARHHPSDSIRAVKTSVAAPAHPSSQSQ